MGSAVPRGACRPRARQRRRTRSRARNRPHSPFRRTRRSGCGPWTSTPAIGVVSATPRPAQRITGPPGCDDSTRDRRTRRARCTRKPRPARGPGPDERLPGGRLIASVDHPTVAYTFADPRPDHFEWMVNGESFPITFRRRSVQAVIDAFTTAGFRMTVITEKSSYTRPLLGLHWPARDLTAFLCDCRPGPRSWPSSSSVVFRPASASKARDDNGGSDEHGRRHPGKRPRCRNTPHTTAPDLRGECCNPPDGGGNGPRVLPVPLPFPRLRGATDSPGPIVWLMQSGPTRGTLPGRRSAGVKKGRFDGSIACVGEGGAGALTGGTGRCGRWCAGRAGR